MSSTDFDTIATGLRRWTKDHDPHVRAAVELLIWHEHWLRHRGFGQAALEHRGHGQVCIDWDEARKFSDSRPGASTSELAVLDLAVALGENRYRLSIMGSAHSQAIAEAVSRAVGIEPGAPPAAPALDIAQRYDTEDARNFLSRWDGLRAGRPDEKLSRMPPGHIEGIMAGLVRKLLEVVDQLAPEGSDRD